MVWSKKLKDMEHTIIEVESNVLSELDTVQEHANNRSERIENRLVCLERNGNSAPNCALALRTEKLVRASRSFRTKGIMRISLFAVLFLISNSA